MTMLEQEDGLKNLPLFAKWQVENASIQAMENSTDAVVLGENPIFGKPLDYESPQDRHPEFPSLNPRRLKE